MIDEAALLERGVALEREGTWDDDLPEDEVAELVKPTMFSNCSQLQANGSLACYNVMEGLQSPAEFGDGTFLGGLAHLPIAAFYNRTYPAVQDRIAEALAGADRVVARLFEKGVVRGTRGLIGGFSVEFYGEDRAWCGYGHVSEEVMAWKVKREVVEPEVDGNAEQKEYSHDASETTSEAEGGGANVGGEVLPARQPAKRRRW